MNTVVNRIENDKPHTRNMKSDSNFRNIPLLIFDLILLPILLIRLILIYIWGSKYNLKGFQFLDVIMHADSPYFNQEDCRMINTIGKDYRIVIRDDSRIFPMDIRAMFGTSESIITSQAMARGDVKVPTNVANQPSNRQQMNRSVKPSYLDKPGEQPVLKVTIGATDNVSKDVVKKILTDDKTVTRSQEWDIMSEELKDDEFVTHDNIGRSKNRERSTAIGNKSVTTLKKRDQEITSDNQDDDTDSSYSSDVSTDSDDSYDSDSDISTVHSESDNGRYQRRKRASRKINGNRKHRSIDVKGFNYFENSDDVSYDTEPFIKKRDDLLDSIRVELDSVFES